VKRTLVLLLLALAAAPALAYAQGGPPGGAPGGPPQGPPEPLKNLKVFPKNTPRDSVLAAMRVFTASLGVRCAYCHAQKHGTNSPDSLDFALDENPRKNKARFMLTMVRDLNAKTLPKVPNRVDPPVQVTCVTCHRGSGLPRTIDAVVAAAIDSTGVQGGIATYRQLRTMTMEQGKYDFSETPMNDLARRLATGGKNADAAALLEMNSELHPASAAIDVQLGDVYRALGQRDKAVVRYRMALEKQPNNQNARRQLTALGETVPPLPAGQGGPPGQGGPQGQPRPPGQPGQQPPAPR
jgi:hypothetical protein